MEVTTENIKRILREYHCTKTVDEDGCGMPLVDMLTTPGKGTIATGIDEIEMLADFVASELSA